MDLGCLMFDVNLFSPKIIGHNIGDLLLAQVDQVLVGGVRGQTSYIEVGSGEGVTLSAAWVGEA